jgi:hypothetical protein
MEWIGVAERTCIVEFIKQYVPERLTSPGYNRLFSPSDVPYGSFGNAIQNARTYTRLEKEGGVLRTRTGIGSRGQLFDAGADGEILLGSGGCEPVFVYRCPVPRQRRAGDGEHVKGELAEVVSAV